MSGEGGGGGRRETGVKFVEGDTWREYSRGVFEMGEFIIDERGDMELAFLVSASVVNYLLGYRENPESIDERSIEESLKLLK